MQNIPEFSVSEFSIAVKRVIEDAFGYVKIRGEISGFKRAASGHVYFSLKDENQDAILSAVCFRNSFEALNFEMADGLQIVAFGKISVFGGRSNYQIIVEKAEIAGLGAIMQMLEKRKNKLSAEGLFDQIHKKTLPFFPRKIAVITSKEGAVLQDIIHRISDRFPTNLLVYPSLVQGKDAAKSVIAGIKFFLRLKKDERPDVLIIARGGGSVEDLLAFSDEDLVRTVFACDIPTISAIGHETDFSLLDYVADLRAPTPTAAAEMATPVLQDLYANLNYQKQLFIAAKSRFFNDKQNLINNLTKFIIEPKILLKNIEEKINNINDKMILFFTNNFSKKQQKLQNFGDLKKDIFTKINFEKQKLLHVERSIKSSSQRLLRHLENQIQNLEKLLKAKNYHEILKRGFCLIKNEKGNLISSIQNIKIKEKIFIEMQDGNFSSYVLDIGRNLENKDLEAKDKNEEIQPKLI